MTTPKQQSERAKLANLGVLRAIEKGHRFEVTENSRSNYRTSGDPLGATCARCERSVFLRSGAPDGLDGSALEHGCSE